jgi:hypothetical protein
MGDDPLSRLKRRHVGRRLSEPVIFPSDRAIDLTIAQLRRKQDLIRNQDPASWLAQQSLDDHDLPHLAIAAAVGQPIGHGMLFFGKDAPEMELALRRIPRQENCYRFGIHGNQNPPLSVIDFGDRGAFAWNDEQTCLLIGLATGWWRPPGASRLELELTVCGSAVGPLQRKVAENLGVTTHAPNGILVVDSRRDISEPIREVVLTEDSYHVNDKGENLGILAVPQWSTMVVAHGAAAAAWLRRFDPTGETGHTRTLSAPNELSPHPKHRTSLQNWKCECVRHPGAESPRQEL